MHRQRFWRAPLQFFPQVLPLVKQLPIGFGQGDGCSLLGNFRAVELVTAAARFLVDHAKIRCHRGHRFFMRFESSELRVVSVSFCFALQHLLGEQGFAP